MHICPRCDSNRSEVVSHSPVAGAWEVLLCPVCMFTWRTSEPDSITDPAKYKSAFKVDPRDIPNVIHVPLIAERKQGRS